MDAIIGKFKPWKGHSKRYLNQTAEVSKEHFQEPVIKNKKQLSEEENEESTPGRGVHNVWNMTPCTLYSFNKAVTMTACVVWSGRRGEGVSWESIEKIGAR